MLFSDIANGIAKYGVMSLDLETEPLEEGLDARDPANARVSLIAMASGKGTGIKAVAVTPTDEAIQFMVEHLRKPEIRVVGHNVFSYDLQVLHHRNIIKLDEVKAKVVDSLPLSWLYNENIPHDLKSMVMTIFKYQMKTYSEAFLVSPNMRMIEALKAEIKHIEKDVIGRVGILFRKAKSAAKKAAEEEYREKWAKRNTAKDREIKNRIKESLSAELETRFGDKAIADEQKRIREELITPKMAEIEYLKREVVKDQRKYAEDDARQTLRLYYRLRRIMMDRNIVTWAQKEIEVRKIASEMELNGVKIDLGRLAILASLVEEAISEFEARVYNIARQEFNLNSPKQIQKVLYNDLAIEPIDATRGTDEKTLSRLAHPIAQALLDYRVVQKINSTYVQKIRSKVMADPGGRLHGRYNTNGPVTGRWSSSGPNLQNIPSRKKAAEYDDRIQDLGARIRASFVPDVDHVFIGADLSQVELRLIAHYTGDANLLEIYRKMAICDGILYYTGDVHDTTRKNVSKMVGFDIGRKLAKNLNFGLCFGMFPPKFAVYAKLFKPGTKEYDIESATRFRDGFFELYPGILEMIEGLHRMREGDENHFPVLRYGTISGRSRYFPKEEWVNGGKIFNSIIQGSAADILKVIIWAIDKFVVKNPRYAGTRLILQVHDEILLEVPAGIAKEVAIMVKFIMEAEWFRLAVPLLASVKICNDWGDYNNDATPEMGEVPSKESGIVPAVAMLTQEQRAWASSQVEVQLFNAVSEIKDFIPIEDLPDAIRKS